jgi:beta-barrel assembly-enhancing protease
MPPKFKTGDVPSGVTPWSRNRLIRKGFVFIPLLFVSNLLSGCTTIYNAATERKESYLINTNMEVSLGRDMDAQVRSKYKISQDPAMQARLDAIGQRLAKVSDRQDLAYTFQVVEDKDLNAFAVPGGFIYVHTALMQASDDEELAGVVAHEIGHIAARHSVKKLQSALGYQLILTLALGISGQEVMGQAMDIVYTLGSLGYSRKDEALADKLSVKYTRKAGYDPHGIISFFEKLKKQAEGHPDYTPVFLRSHPPTQERIDRIKKEIEASGYGS